AVTWDRNAGTETDHARNRCQRSRSFKKFGLLILICLVEPEKDNVRNHTGLFGIKDTLAIFQSRKIIDAIPPRCSDEATHSSTQSCPRVAAMKPRIHRRQIESSGKIRYFGFRLPRKRKGEGCPSPFR